MHGRVSFSRRLPRSTSQPSSRRSRLSSARRFSAIEIAQFPDKAAAYRLTHRIGAALVAWRGATYGALIDTAAVVQARRLEFEITLLVRDLGWSFGGDSSGPNPGAYSLLESIRAALTGLRLPGCRKMFPLREQFLGRDPQGGVWIWSALYALETMALEASTQDNFPVFVKGTALEEGWADAPSRDPGRIYVRFARRDRVAGG